MSDPGGPPYLRGNGYGPVGEGIGRSSHWVSGLVAAGLAAAVSVIVYSTQFSAQFGALNARVDEFHRRLLSIETTGSPVVGQLHTRVDVNTIRLDTIEKNYSDKTQPQLQHLLESEATQDEVLRILREEVAMLRKWKSDQLQAQLLDLQSRVAAVQAQNEVLRELLAKAQVAIPK